MRKRIILPLVVLLVLVVTFAGSVAFFSYAQKGNTENSIQMGDLTFKYTEVSKIGHGINLNEGYPMSEAEGKVLEEYFDFKVESNLSRSDLEYSVEIDTTLSEIPDSGIRVYLVEVVNGEEKEISSIVNLLSSYETSEDGRIIYKETIPRNTKNYEKNFRLRLWIDESIDWTDDEYIGHSGIYKVNVNANSDTSMASSDVVTDRTATIERVVANNKYLFTESSDTDVDYEVTVPYTVTNIDVEVYESNTQATSETTKLNSLEGVSSRTENQNISTGNNYFKTVVTASNGRNEEEYILKVVKEADPRNDLLNLGVEGYSLTPSFDPNVTEYTLILEEPSINITGTPVSGIANIEGTGEKTLTYGENTFNIVVTPEDTNTAPKTYTITVDNQRPIAPTITGGTGTTWVASAKTISLADNNTAFAISGIDHYDVYVASDSTAPTDATEPTTTTQDTYTPDNGINYVYYRTVSSKGIKSVWSSAQIVYLDTNTYTITYTLNGGSASNNTSYNVETDSFTLTNPTRTGYTFAGWSGTELSGSANKTVTISKGSSGNRSYTANWTANKYTVTLNQQSGSGGTGSVTATYGSAMPGITKPSRTGYTFGGYYTGTGGSGTQYYTSAGASARAWAVAGNTTLYAYWIPIQYTFKFNANGGSGSMANQTFNYGTAQTLRANAFSRSGKTFVGWSTVSGTQLLYYSATQKTGSNEFMQYGVDLSPYFNSYGSRVYSIRADVRSANVSKNNTIAVYAQNGSGQRWGFNGAFGGVTTSFQTKRTSFTPVLMDSSISASQLAFFGQYNTGNIPTVKNVYFMLGEYYFNQESINNFTTTNGQVINLYAVWQ